MNYVIFLLFQALIIVKTASSRLKSKNRMMQNNNNTVPVPPSTNATTPTRPTFPVPIPLPPTFHPRSPLFNEFQIVRTPRAPPVIGNETVLPRPTNGNFTPVPETPGNLTRPIAGATVPLVPAALTMLDGKTRTIPLNYWVASGNKTFIILRNENNYYLKCEKGLVTGESRSGNLSDVSIGYMWEPELLNDTHIHFKTYDGNYLDYGNFTFNCNATTAPQESYKVIKGSFTTGGANENKTDYLSFIRDMFYLGIQDAHPKLILENNPSTKFLPVFNRTEINNTTSVPSS